MPLPTKDPVAFRGVPSLGAERKMALSMTLTQKQVEAMFARQATLRELGESSHYPLEIDFDENKIYIGDIATPFNSIKEDGTREICQRSPTVSRPLAGISLSGVVIGKLNIHRDFDQAVADNVRKATEAELSKRNERTIIRLDTPPVLANGKKGKSGSGASALAKKAMSNRIVSAQAASSHQPTSSQGSRPSTPVASSSAPSTMKPPSSSTRPTQPSSRASAKPPTPTSSATPASSQSSSKEVDPSSLRARLIHYLALEPRTTQQVLLEIGGRSPSPETVHVIEDLLNVVAHEVPPARKGDPGPLKWDLESSTWEHVRPYEWPDLTTEERTRMARKGRIRLEKPPTDAIWEHFTTRVPDTNVVPPVVKGKGKAAVGQTLVKKSDFKGGMFPKEKKASTKGGGVTSGGVTKPKTSTAKAKAKKDQGDEVEVKVRKVVDGLAADAKVKSKASSSSLAANPPSTTKIPKKKQEEDDYLPSSSKARSSVGSIKKELSPLPPKPRRVQDEGSLKRRHVELELEANSDMEEGEVPSAPHGTKKRKVTGEPTKPRLSTNPSDTRDTSTTTTTKKSIKEKDRTAVKEESTPPRSSKDLGASSKASASVPSSRTVTSGSKISRTEREEKAQDTREQERLQERERRPSIKRSRRAPPTFSSDEEEDSSKKPTAPVRAPPTTTSKAKLPPRPPSSKPAAPATKSASVPASRAPAPSPALPSDKEALRRRYHTCYARYMGVTSKFHEQRAKIEALLATDTDSVTVDDDVDMMDAEQLMQLRGEHERLRDELERILHAHANAMVF
ncbi:hypothetical protein K439DRAFT_1632206 [Ramaria rubella]|nr:hypothetical protein K439DRAFT_1632206 [Ramaria rubella]